MENNNRKLEIDVTWVALFKVLAFITGIFLAIQLRDILFMLLVVFIFVAAINPTIKSWQKHVSRTVAVSAFFVLILAALVLIGYLFVPMLVRQLTDLVNSFPDYLEKAKPYLASDSVQKYSTYIDQAKGSILDTVKGWTGNIFSTTVSFFGGLASVVMGLILAFYILLEEKNAREFFHQIFPTEKYQAVYVTLRKISEKLGSWVRGQLLVMLIIGSCNTIGFVILGIHSPLPLGVWSGIMEAIPYVGPALGVLPALLISFAAGNYIQALLVFIVNFILIQQLEANFVVPKLMGKAVGISPVLVILSLIIGFQLFGFLGAIIALPVAAVISVIVGEWGNLRKNWEDAEVLKEEPGS